MSAVAIDCAVDVDIALASEQRTSKQVGCKAGELPASGDRATNCEVLYRSRQLSEETGIVSVATLANILNMVSIPLMVVKKNSSKMS